MRRHLVVRVLAGYIAISLVALGAFAGFTINLSRRLSFDALTRGLSTAARTALVAVEPLMAQGRSPGMETLVTAMGSQGGVRITVIDRAGVVLADSQDNPAAMENHSLRPEVAEALAGRVGTAWRLSNTERVWMIYVAIPVVSNGGVVRAALYPRELDTAVSRTEESIALFGSALFLACVVTAWFLSRSITAPLSDLAGVVQRYAAGDFGARLHLKRRDEIRTLAETFNLMGERVQQLFQERTRSAQELDSVFTSVQQGILVLAGDGRIIRANRGFTDLAEVRPVEGRTLWEALRAPRLTELVQQARSSGQRQAEEITIGERIVLCAVERMPGRDELIVFLSDTTDLRRLETVKRDFVVNASHELRTPLTSIVGSLEMLEGRLAEDDERWVQAIRRNADRMAAIVADMLTLSRLEARGSEPSAAPVDVARMVRDVAGMFAHRAETQGIALSVSVAPDLPLLAADGFLLEQMLVNLVDNALKYTEKGSVEITAAVDGADVRLEVRDTGIGIPAESLPRIFERFYVVDKSRSRKLGGTGLGLAIVKHIVSAHRGTISVDSVPGEGTRFTVRLPRTGN